MSKDDLERRVEQMKQKEAQGQTRGGGFQSMGQILKKIVDSKDGKSDDPEPMKPKSETFKGPCKCRACGKDFEGDITRYNWMNPPKEIPSTECSECYTVRIQNEESQAELVRESLRIPMRAKWRKECGMPSWLLVKTFNNWDRRIRKQAYNTAFEWAKGFDLDDPRGYKSLILYSEKPGVGKGHLMSGIVNYVIEHWKGDPARRLCPIRFESGPSLVRRIRATYQVRSEDQTHEREDEVYNALAGVPLLELDDVGKEKPSDFTRETYWYIIDERVKTGLPVIISSRLPLEGKNSLVELMGTDTVDRLYGMTGGYVEFLEGDSYRRVNAIP